MVVRIYPYNPHSGSAKALSEKLNVKRIKHLNSKYRPRDGDTIINWGSSNLPNNLVNLNVFNNPKNVSTATDKLSLFNLFGENNNYTVPWTTSTDVVRSWLENGKIVVARTKLRGHSGEGIVLLEGAGADIVEAPLYTLYTPKKEEYRVHVVRVPSLVRGFKEPVIFDIQRKAKRADVPKEEANYYIRNLAGGFIYARQDLVVPKCVEDVALKIFDATGLDFGAVDVIYNEKRDKAYGLEVNTAPGLTGTTLDKYAEIFNHLID